ncbi:MAG TPA: ribosomal-processing cysteine protease Prp [Oscillospiraceae bacterium]|nr:ribosomal-processing cysteine protease Prp [Oscillospiraceae bacterium]
MICASFLTSASGELVGFNISGHSGQGDVGSDIICAAVSSAAYLTANTITEIIKADATVEANDGEMFVRVSKKDAVSCRTVFAGFKLHMIGLEEQYPQNINVSYMEV